MAPQASTAVATLPTEESERFGLMQREAKLFASSPLIPQHLRNGGPEQAMANCYIALKMARTMGEDPLVVLQNIHVVNGKAGFATQYMIARANSSGVFKGRINWRVDRSDASNLKVTAYATLADTEELVEFTCDMAMAQAEGWTKNPKYKSMGEVMLRYRSAAFLVRFYAPDVMLGYHTADEVEDVYAAANLPSPTALTADMLTEQARPAEEIADPETGEIVDAIEEPAKEVEYVETEPVAEAEPLPEITEDPATAERETDQSPAAEFLAKVRGQIANAKNASYLKATEEEWLKNRVVYSEDVQAEIDGLITAKRKALAGGEGGK